MVPFLFQSTCFQVKRPEPGCDVVETGVPGSSGISHARRGSVNEWWMVNLVHFCCEVVSKPTAYNGWLLGMILIWNTGEGSCAEAALRAFPILWKLFIPQWNKHCHETFTLGGRKVVIENGEFLVPCGFARGYIKTFNCTLIPAFLAISKFFRTEFWQHDVCPRNADAIVF